MSRVVLLALVTACGGARPAPRIAVLPEVWATTRPEAAEPAAPRITKTLDAHQLDAVADAESSAAVAGEGDACVEDLACLRRVGERLRVAKLVTLKLAELGGTLAVQLTLVDVQRAAREATMREVVNPNEASRIAATLDGLGTRVARQAGAPGSKTRTWWWIAASTVAVGLTATTVLIVAGRDDNPDTVIVPP